jgi:hypothetical protein
VSDYLPISIASLDAARRSVISLETRKESRVVLLNLVAGVALQTLLLPFFHSLLLRLFRYFFFSLPFNLSLLSLFTLFIPFFINALHFSSLLSFPFCLHSLLSIFCLLLSVFSFLILKGFVALTY